MNKWLILRLLVVGFLYLLLCNGITIVVKGDVILFINGVLFRYALLSDVLYFIFEFLVPFLYEKFNSSVSFLFDNIDKKC